MMHSRQLASKLVIAAALALPLTAKADTSAWIIDAAHSRVGFEVSHLVVSSVTGRFKDVSASVSLDEANLSKSDVEVTIQATSIDTGEAKRDEHLRSADFFDVAKYPLIVFQSTKVAPVGAGKYKLSGELSMHGVSRPITLDASLSQPVKNPWGKLVRGVKATGQLKRSDYGLTWNKTLDAGGVVVGDVVKLDIQVEINR